MHFDIEQPFGPFWKAQHTNVMNFNDNRYLFLLPPKIHPIVRDQT